MAGAEPAAPMPDSAFRVLTAGEEAAFRRWAREHAAPADLARAGVLHPVVRDEWRRMGLLPADGAPRRGEAGG